MFDTVFSEIAALLIVAALVGSGAIQLRQPLIVAFIGVGILVGPGGLDWVHSADQVDLLAKLGIALLLFVVGLKLDLHLIRTFGSVALATGLGQVIFTSAFGYLLAIGLGLTPVDALYVAVGLTFSSTIIIVKLLSDKREIDALHGRIAIGFLIVQDIVVVLVMIALSALGAGGQTGHLGITALLVLLKGAAFLAGSGLLMRFVLPRLLHHLARSPELLLLFVIAFAISMAALSDSLGFSKEVGAFLAGVSLASTPFRETIGARLVGLRDFLLLFFFLDLGAQLDLSSLGGQLGPAVVLSVFVLIGNPLIVMIIMGAMGYRKRTGFLAGLTVAQISEFSLILAALGMSLGHITAETMGLITLVGLITIGLSTYMILFSQVLYERLAPWLSVFERNLPHREELSADAETHDNKTDVVVFGLGRYGNNIAQSLRQRGFNPLGVDFNPEAVKAWHSQHFPAWYGDAEAPEFLASLPLYQTRWVISTLPQRDINMGLLQALRNHGYRGQVALTAHSLADATILRAEGAHLVLLPFADAAERATEVLASFEQQGQQHIV